MTYKTHAKFAITLTGVTLLLSSNIHRYNILDIAGSFVVAIVSSLVPDLDHENSFLRTRIMNPILTGLLIYFLIWRYKIYILIISVFWLIFAYFSKHRGFTHSILGLLIFILPFIGSVYFYPILIGYSSHLLMDGFTNRGIKLFFPYDKKIKLANITTGSGLEKFIGFVLTPINLLLILILFNKMFSI